MLMLRLKLGVLLLCVLQLGMLLFLVTLWLHLMVLLFSGTAWSMLCWHMHHAACSTHYQRVALCVSWLLHIIAL